MATNIVEAAREGNIQACWIHPVFLHAVHTTQLVHLYHSIHSISFHQPQLTNTTRLTLPRPAPKTHKQKSYVRRLILGSLDMPCLVCNFPLVMCIHASTQKVQYWLDNGVGPDDHKDPVSIFAVTGLVSMHIRLGYIVTSLPL